VATPVNVQTLTESDGKVGWGVYGSTWTYREGVGAERSSGGLGKFTIAGRVLDVEVMVGKTVVYTGVNGEFEFAVRKKRADAVAVEGRKGVSGSGDRTGRSGYGCW
jgi:hypothetical protein